MNNRAAYLRAKRALDAADEASNIQHERDGGGWSEKTTGEIYEDILRHLQREFKQGVRDE